MLISFLRLLKHFNYIFDYILACAILHMIKWIFIKLDFGLSEMHFCGFFGNLPAYFGRLSSQILIQILILFSYISFNVWLHFFKYHTWFIGKSSRMRISSTDFFKFVRHELFYADILFNTRIISPLLIFLFLVFLVKIINVNVVGNELEHFVPFLVEEGIKLLGFAFD